MIELDYAFLADYANVGDGKLTAVGASFTEMAVPGFPANVLLSVAGRIRCSVDLEDLQILIRVFPPDESYKIEVELSIAELENLSTYDGKRGLLFAAQVQVPLPMPGLYRVEVDIRETEGIDRVLKFRAVAQ